MKKYPLSLLIVSWLAALSAAAHAAPEIYGSGYTGLLYEFSHKATTDLGTNVVTVTNEQSDIINYPSLGIGFKGKETLNDKLSVEYKLSYSVKFNGTKTSLSPSNTYLGIAHKDYGSLKVGRLSVIDDISVDESWLYAKGTGTPFSYGGNDKINSSFIYESPKFNQEKTQITVQYAMPEGGKQTKFDVYDWANRRYTTVNGHLGAVKVSHEANKTFYDVSYVQVGRNFKALRGAISSDINDKLTLGVMGQVVDYHANNIHKEWGALASAYYQYSTPLAFYAQAGYAANYKGQPDSSKAVASLGASYDFNENITWYASASRADEKVSYTFSDDSAKTFQNERYSEQAMAIESGLSFSF